MKYIIAIIILLMSACSTKNNHKIEKKQNHVIQENRYRDYAIIRSVNRNHIFDLITTWSKIELIERSDKVVVYKSSALNSKSFPFAKIIPGKYKIKFTCRNGDGWNKNYLDIEPVAGEDYTVFCIRENRGKDIYGNHRIAAFHPFFEKTDEVSIKKDEYQKIINDPPRDDLKYEVPIGHTRVIVYYEPATIFGAENHFTYSISIDGKIRGAVNALKYTTLILLNGEYDVEMCSDAAILKDTVKFNLKAEGNNLYVRCKESHFTSMKCEIIKEKPDNFDGMVKPMKIFIK